MERATLAIEGMHCGICVNHVTRALKGVDGVTVEKVEVGSAEVAYDGSRVKPERLADAVRDAGYEAKVTASKAPAESCSTSPKKSGGGGCGCCH